MYTLQYAICGHFTTTFDGEWIIHDCRNKIVTKSNLLPETILILDSERSDECIDFTMIITSQNNASISNFGGGFRWKSEYPWCIIQVKSNYFSTVFKKNREKQKKNDGKTGIFTQNQFSAESIFLYGCNSKTNHCKNLKFSPNVYTTEYFDFFFEVLFKFLRNLSKTRKFAIILKIKNTTLMRLNFKSLRNRVTITIYPQTILNICYYSKSIKTIFVAFAVVKMKQMPHWSYKNLVETVMILYHVIVYNK
ncbi:hypothetical protein AGLY_010346 [Aphis glycines]|uniref:Uncharacterized protein n=1 Tax=Aphis glycines TaxID=307491 RepID=A0A6G0THY4_APHGL|nr:hypothetical protein AGLY_010346 [Aphis glycines]